jgi:60 kDa SS-A/Ro ribonucleoprotein
MNYSKHFSTKQTPQSQPIPGSTQIANSAGGFTWAVDEWDRLDRFLILGTEGGSYYAGEKDLTVENAKAIHKLIQLDGPRVVARISEISDKGRAPKNDPAIFALALALKKGDDKTRGLAAAAVPSVCRIGTHIFQLAEAVKHLGGWGRNTKGAFAHWYLNQTPDQLSMNLAKYQSREGWSHRDILRKAHVKPPTPWQNAMLKWAVGKVTGADQPEAQFVGPVISAFEQAKVIAKGGVSKKATHEIVSLITSYNLPRECIPTEFLNELDVWEALLISGKHGMPMTAMIRNLAKMTEIGLLKPTSDATKFVKDKLRNTEALKAARVHPIQLLLALSTYRQGHGLKGSLSWTPAQPICDALDDAFYKAFAFVEPTGKRFMLALDVSGSMSQGNVAGTPLTPREASAAMALVTAKTEERYCVVGFTSGGGGYGGRWDSANAALTQINKVNAKASLPEAIQAVSELSYGGTDCALPMIYAEKNKIEIDAFVIYTDSETWAGTPHPSQALRSYREKMGIDAKLIVNGMVSNNFTIADPNDRGMLDVVGFDTNVPVIMADFLR